jgi:hypothetical protein
LWRRLDDVEDKRKEQMKKFPQHAKLSTVISVGNFERARLQTRRKAPQISSGFLAAAGAAKFPNRRSE